MAEQNNGGEGAKLIIILIVAGVLAWVLLNIVFMLGMLLVVCMTAGSVFYGFKLGHQIAMESDIWENRRIAKHQKLHAEREKEKAYFTRKGIDRMSAVVEMHYDDKERELYKDKNPLDDALNAVKKVKDVFKR